MTRNQKLELTWVGKDARPRLEPRILLEDATLSYHAAARVTAHDRFDNLLIQGDNLLALKALEQEYAGKVKCVFIDPPYNTGSAFEHYDDGIEHSLWLSMMRDRLELLRNLLSEDGSIWITIDDNEAHYLKVLLDEVFGRSQFVATVIWRKNYSPKSSARQFSVDHDYVLVYCKEGATWRPNPMPRSADQDRIYKNPDNDPRGRWRPSDLSARNSYSLGLYGIVTPSGREIPSPPNGRFWSISKAKLQELDRDGRIWWGKNRDSIPSLKRFLSEVIQGRVPQTYWPYEEVGHTQDAKKEAVELSPSDVFGTPKPEALMSRIVAIATNPGDLVLDSFLGSGTTAAVAHKMGRRWIGIELGDHAVTHCVPRLRKVIDGEDTGGVTAQTNWRGGGGFRFARLAPSLLKQDAWGNWVISTEYNADMLSQALCKLENFRYDPSTEHFWQQGRSSERDFLYATTQTLSAVQLEWLSEAVGPDRSLLVLCRAWMGNADAWPNLTLRKVPNAVLGRCEFGRDDYSLRIAALPAASDLTDDAAQDAAAPATVAAPRAHGARKRATRIDNQPSLLPDEPDANGDDQ